MTELLTQIKIALGGNLYYLALFVSLTMPDICGAMESANGEATSAKYKAWFNKYVEPKYTNFLTAEDCYYYRCSLLHQGTSQHPRSSYKRIVFIEPSPSHPLLHKGDINNLLCIDVRLFCGDIILGVEQWQKDVENTDTFKTNYEKFIKRYPRGIFPDIVGVPVIG